MLMSRKALKGSLVTVILYKGNVVDRRRIDEDARAYFSALKVINQLISPLKERIR